MRELITLCANGESRELAVLPHHTLLGREPGYLPRHELEGRCSSKTDATTTHFCSPIAIVLEWRHAEPGGAIMTESRFDIGMKVRKEVLGSEHVGRVLSNGFEARLAASRLIPHA
jgi:hypothetical protein